VDRCGAAKEKRGPLAGALDTRLFAPHHHDRIVAHNPGLWLHFGSLYTYIVITGKRLYIYFIVSFTPHETRCLMSA
jgi:hypothetical protein